MSNFTTAISFESPHEGGKLEAVSQFWQVSGSITTEEGPSPLPKPPVSLSPRITHSRYRHAFLCSKNKKSIIIKIKG